MSMIHLAYTGQPTWDSCPRCRRTLWQMQGTDDFTSDAEEANCA